MEHIIGVKELREKLGHVEKRVSAGQSFVVMKRSKPIFTIRPIDEGGWETVIDFTKFKKNGMPIADLIKRLKRIG